MPREGYIAELRAAVGTRPLLMPSVAVFVHDAWPATAETKVVTGRHHDTGRWVIPGGGVELGEPPADCAVREAWEETGLAVDLVRVRGTYGGTDEHRVEYPNGDVCDYVVTVFDAVVADGELPAATDELVELRWVTLAEMRELDLQDWLRPVLDHPNGWEPLRWRPPAST